MNAIVYKLEKVCLFFITTVLLFSCEKIDNNPLGYYESRFFELNNNVNPILKRIILNLKRQEEIKPYVQKFVLSEGYPIWSEAKIKIQKSKYKHNRDSSVTSDTLVLVPIVPIGQTYVKDILGIKVNNEILYKLFEGIRYAEYGFNNDVNRTEPNAEDIAKQIIEFESKLFNSYIYLIKDNRLFDYWNSSNPKPSNFFIIGSKLTTLDDDGPEDDECITWMQTYSDDGGITWHDTGITWEEGDCDVDEYDVPYGGGGSGNGDGGWTTSAPSGGTSGGGSGGTNSGGSGSQSCSDGWEKIVVNTDGIYLGSCTDPGPIPPTPPNEDDIETTFSVDCQSFEFTQTTIANWQEAGVNNIRLKWQWIGPSNIPITREIYINHIVFGLPTQYANGDIVSPGQAANICAQVLDQVKLATYVQFRTSPTFPSDAVVELYFKNLLHQTMTLVAGTAGATGSGSPNIRFHNEVRSFFDPRSCN